MTAAVLAVDGGNSKTDVALIGPDGALLAAVRGPTCSHQAVGFERAMAQLGRLVSMAVEKAGLGEDGPLAEVGVYRLAGADFGKDVRLLERGIHGRFATRDVILNDTFAALRAGAQQGWGVVLICGQGINGAAIAPNGRTARFAAIGDLSGDWGGGGALGSEALAAAIRAGDGRGPRTTLRRTVAEHFGMARPESVMRAMYDERISSRRLSELSPAVFRDAEAGDAVARSIIDRLADELAVMAVALIRRLHMAREEVEVVLAGGVFGATDPAFYGRITAAIQLVAPHARLVRLTVPPVVGSALLGFDRLARDGLAPAEVAARVRAELGGWRPPRSIGAPAPA
jgi:N-acetylglucosamine kinase-like BadF-type ATPase